MTKGQILYGFVLAFAALLLGMPVAASEGEIVYTDGDVLVAHSSSEEEAFIGMQVGKGDTVETLEDSLAVIRLAEGTEIKMRESTMLSLESLGNHVSVNLTKGGVFSRVLRQAVDHYEVRTHSAVAGVRGTEFFVAFGRTIDEKPDIWLCVNEGSVEVSIAETSERVVVEEGQGINIVGGVKLTSPKFYPWTQELNWNTDPSAGDVKDATDLDQAYSDLLDQDYD
jgi:ferric-dicitrate binding protein FerR (iron transport regulator)